jgi:hypothetical protein
MLGFLKALPLIVFLAISAYGAHTFIVKQKDTRITQLQSQVDLINQQNVALQSAAALNEQTIRGLEEKSRAQVAQMGTLTNRNNELNAERDSYMQIFRDHDLTKLARARPGMIETRANSATADVFRSVEAASKEVDQLDDSAAEAKFDNSETQNNE